MAAQAAIYGGMAALELAGGYFAAQNIKATAELNQDIADMNEEFAELDAYDSEVEGWTQQARYQSVIDNTLADQKVALQAADVDASFGSASTIEESTRFTSQLNLMQIQKEANQQALGYKRQARDIGLNSSMAMADAKTRAGQAQFSAVTSAAKTGLTGYEKAK